MPGPEQEDGKPEEIKRVLKFYAPQYANRVELCISKYDFANPGAFFIAQPALNENTSPKVLDCTNAGKDALPVRAVSATLRERKYVLLNERDEQTCPDSFMCPYRVGASAKYP